MSNPVSPALAPLQWNTSEVSQKLTLCATIAILAIGVSVFAILCATGTINPLGVTTMSSTNCQNAWIVATTSLTVAAVALICFTATYSAKKTEAEAEALDDERFFYYNEVAIRNRDLQEHSQALQDELSVALGKVNLYESEHRRHRALARSLD